MRVNRLFLSMLPLLLLLVTAGSISAQERMISGSVTDKVTSEPLPGVSVIVDGTTRGTVTDFDGNFTLKVAETETLNISFIGYLTQKLLITNQTSLTVELATDTQDLGEVLIVGYGVVKKEDKTGAVYSVSSEDLQTVAVQDPIESIQGKVAGVTIRKGGSDPNGGFDVNIRGASGLSSGTNPTYVVDGVVGVDPTTVAPEDIESFNVLKDASSTAIYGSRGANGIIIITTKSGKAGKSKIDFNTSATVDQISKSARLDLMSADEYRAYGNERGIDVRDMGADTDWQDEIYRTGITQNYNMSLSGGNEFGNYRASVTHNDMEGIVENSAKQRTIMRLNTMTKLFEDKLKVTMNLSNTIEHNDYINYGSSGADGSLYQAFQRNPTLPVYAEDGSYYQDPTPPVNNYSNPVAVINDIQNERDAKRLLANIKAEYTILDGLVATVNGSYTQDDDESFYFEPAANTALPGNGKGKRQYNNKTEKLIETFVNYNKSFGKHNLNAVGGYSNQQFMNDGFYAQGLDPASDFNRSHSLDALARVNPGDVSSWKESSKLISGFGRVAYNFDSKYYVTGTLRRDGSTRFGANNEWGWFPSGSVSWNMKRESFLENVDKLSQLKLRLGYGLTGNQNFENYRDISYYTVKGYTRNPITNEWIVNYGPNNNPNPNLQWEVNTEMHVGIDFGLFENRINGSLDIYSKETSNLLYEYTVSNVGNATDKTWANAGVIDVDGFDLTLNGYVIDNSRFKWETSMVFTHYKAIVKELGNEEFRPQDFIGQGWLGEPLGVGVSTQILAPGLEQGTFFGPKVAGINKDTGKWVYHSAEEGIYKTYDQLEQEDWQVLGSQNPDIEIGWSNTFKIGSAWDVSFMMRGMFGHKILNATEMVFGNPTYFPTRNVLKTAPENTQFDGPSNFSDYFLEDGDFVRLENFTIGYNLSTKPESMLKRARVYVAGNNLWTITKYDGVDPGSIGIDFFNVYPKSTSVTMGVNVSF